MAATSRIRRQVKRLYRVAIAAPLIVVAALVAADELELSYSIVVIATLAPAWYLIWTMFSRQPASEENSGGGEDSRASLLTSQAQSVIDILPDALILMDGDHRVLEANKAARNLFGVRLAGRDFSQILRHPDAVEAMDHAISAREQAQADITILSPGERHFMLTALPMDIGDSEERARRSAAVALHEVTALKRAEQLRAEFVANASHELRTPLASLIGFIETLQGPARDDPEVRDKFLDIMAQESARMARLIQDLLSLSRIELDEHVSPAGAADAGRVLQNVAEALSMKAAEKDMSIVIDMGDVAPRVMGDSDQLTQVFQNLIDNAIKYGRQGTSITVSARPVMRLVETGGPALAFSVKNEGEGIPREHLPRLTDRFYRVDAARSRQLGGTGLGLAIVKHIVNRHRGRLTFDSELGVGTTVTVFLPAPVATASPKAAQ